MDGFAGAARGARSLTTWPTTGGAPSWARRNPHDEHSLPYGDPYHSPPEDLPPRARQELMKTKNRTQPRGDLE